MMHPTLLRNLLAIGGGMLVAFYFTIGFHDDAIAALAGMVFTLFILHDLED